MLDAAPHTRLDADQQDAAAAHERCQAPSGSRPVWCVVATYPQAERRAHAALHRVGFHAYLPLITVRWADRTWHTRPLFPGYCFVRMRLDRPWSPVTYAPGVFSLLSFDGKPATCSDAAVDALQATEALRATPTPQISQWAPGMPCRLRKGHPMEGADAVVTDVGATIARIAIMMLGHLRNVSVHLDALAPRENS
jgi:transcription antitermination factor NusG